MSKTALEAAKNMAEKVTTALGGYGVFGVELFIKDDTVIFSEVSPRPHDTGLVTLISQDLSEGARRLGVSVALGDTIETALDKAKASAEAVKIQYN